MQENEWFQSWFNQTYTQLYQHRDEAEAARQVNHLFHQLALPKQAKILDLACGSGRHLKELKKKFSQVVGLDLSWALLTQVESPLRIRADMRFLPLKWKSFDVVTLFFSSFGYFSQRAEHVAVIKQIAHILGDRGYLYLDIHNKSYTLQNLVESDEKQFDWAKVSQVRKFQNPYLTKTITIHRVEGQTETYQERMHLFEQKEIEDLVSPYFKVLAIWGNEQGDIYQPGESPRMIFLLKKVIT